MARPKNNPDYNPEKARDELIQAVVDLYENPPEAEQADKDGHTKMKYMQQEFGLSMTKIRKLLVTGGVYEFWKDDIELVSEIAEMREDGLTDDQIREELSISVGTLNSLTPYRSGTYNADFTADGYDYSNVSTDARRKRSQRKREKMRETNIVNEHEDDIQELRRQMDEQKYPGMTPEEIEKEKARRRAENEARHQAKLEKKRKYHERKAAAEEKDPGGYLHLAELYGAVLPDYAAKMRLLHDIEMRRRAGESISQAEVDRLVEELEARFEETESDIEEIDDGENVMYVPAIDYDAYDRMSPEQKKADEELMRRLFEAMAEREEVELPEIDVETYGTKWMSTKSVNGRPIGDFLFTPDFSYKYLFPDICV